MKKFLISIIALMLAISFALTATGCSQVALLTFNNNFTGGKLPSEIVGQGKYSETLVYDVERVKTYENISTSNLLKHNAPEYKGTYTVTFNNYKPADIDISKSDIKDNETFKNSAIYHLKSVLDLEVNVNGTIYNDKIISECVFYQANLSFAPIWSKTTMKNTYLSLIYDNITCTQNIYQFETFYNQDSYTLTKKYYAKENKDENINDIVIEDNSWTSDKLVPMTNNAVKTYEYTARSAIDNNQLLFAIRNISFSQNSKDVALPTVSYAYGEPRVIQVTLANEESVSLRHDLETGDLLDNNQTTTILVNKLTFALGDSTYTGSKKYVKIQKKTTDENNQVEFRALLVEYAEPLVDANNAQFGALKYTLKSATLDTQTI